VVVFQALRGARTALTEARVVILSQRLRRKETAMLEMKEKCERCGRDLPSSSQEAMFCSFECTFCSHCSANELKATDPGAKEIVGKHQYNLIAHWIFVIID
jgi:hypothetical protein